MPRELCGKVLLVDFWAMWCGPCVKKLPQVNSLQKRFGERGLVVLGVHANQNSENLTAFVDGHLTDPPFDAQVEAELAKTYEP